MNSVSDVALINFKRFWPRFQNHLMRHLPSLLCLKSIRFALAENCKAPPPSCITLRLHAHFTGASLRTFDVRFAGGFLWKCFSSNDNCSESHGAGGRVCGFEQTAWLTSVSQIPVWNSVIQRQQSMRHRESSQLLTWTQRASVVNMNLFFSISCLCGSSKGDKTNQPKT